MPFKACVNRCDGHTVPLTLRSQTAVRSVHRGGVDPLQQGVVGLTVHHLRTPCSGAGTAIQLGRGGDARGGKSRSMPVTSLHTVSVPGAAEVGGAADGTDMSRGRGRDRPGGLSPRPPQEVSCSRLSSPLSEWTFGRSWGNRGAEATRRHHSGGAGQAAGPGSRCVLNTGGCPGSPCGEDIPRNPRCVPCKGMMPALIAGKHRVGAEKILNTMFTSFHGQPIRGAGFRAGRVSGRDARDGRGR